MELEWYQWVVLILHTIGTAAKVGTFMLTWLRKEKKKPNQVN